MHKPLTVVAVVAMMALIAPLASANAAFDDSLPGRVPVLLGPAFLQSNPVFQSTRLYTVSLKPGDHLGAHLTWDAAGPTGNDLDLTLLLPSGAPCSLPLPPTPDALLCTVNSRVARTTCTDTAASSHNHQLTGGPADERIDYTVPAGGETGTYTLLVRGFLITTASQNYHIDITTAAGVVQGPLTTFITTGVNCELP